MKYSQTEIPEAHEDSHKKPHNGIWWGIILVVVVPALVLAWSTINQPSGNQSYFAVDPPNFGQGFDIDYAAIEDEELKLTVSYPGGCEEHNFDMYVESQKSDINRLITIHHTSEDTCDTRVIEDLKYDLTRVIEEHDSEQIIFTIKGNGKEPEPVLFKKPIEKNDGI